MPLPRIDPPLINSANPWASSKEDLQALYDCPHTGAVTCRTSLLKGFRHDPAIHQYTFYDPRDHSLVPKEVQDGDVPSDKSGSLNTLGYSPIPLSEYIEYIRDITSSGQSTKPFVISVTGSPSEVRQCHDLIRSAQVNIPVPLCMEINLSCPNILDKPPPAYSGPALLEYLEALYSDNSAPSTPVGIKTPPYTYADQFNTLISTILSATKKHTTCPVSFITATNTLGSCLLLADSTSATPALASASGAGIGGLAGAPLHPIALGNVKTLRTMLDQHEELKAIDVIGIGGVSDKASYDRMTSVGARVVGVGTALGREGVAVFGKILQSTSA
ncbi:dihydroorotate dehydrogenase [Zalaria obscura]|uniref:Dihydroorotate dehydrogenase n=1 Tax=Zalaria obscura TaxID=2024903 RepID=A0ACC3S5F1_9PEZI